MRIIESSEVVRRIRAENPWWGDSHTISEPLHTMRSRAYFELFLPLVKESVRRAIVLMGPRRVGKTVMIHHTIRALLAAGVRPASLCYFSVDHPIYNGLSLEKLLDYYRDASGVDYASQQVYVFFDEIQYLRKWEEHLKSLVDTYANIKFVASGSAAAALRLKSTESGAGRLTDFLLPPLTFYEYLDLMNKTDLVQAQEDGAFSAGNLGELNDYFLSYLNFGGYPEVIFSEAIQADPARFIKSDIIDKVLLRDLPSLYGIDDIQELNYLFTTLAFNTANEISLGELSQNSSVAKNTIKRYIDYLEAAFLVKVIHRVDHTAKRFHRANFFKVYLTNPSMRAALFSPLQADDPALPALVETAVFSQWFHSINTLHYARWRDGEVDIVMLGPKQKAQWVVEVKWSDRYCDSPHELANLIEFSKRNKISEILVTSRTKVTNRTIEGVPIEFMPASTYCYAVGYNIVHGRKLAPQGLDLRRKQSR